MRLLVAAYVVLTVGVAVAMGLTLGREIFPPSGVKAFQLRFRAPAGTKFESTERLARQVLDVIGQTAGRDQVDITLGYVGVQPTSYPINTIFLWTGGSHEGVLQVALRPDVAIVHAQRASAAGDTQVWGLLGCQKEAAFAADRVIVVVEEVVSSPEHAWLRTRLSPSTSVSALTRIESMSPVTTT